MCFLMWLKKRQKDEDKGAEIAAKILKFGKPEARKASYEDWKEHLRGKKKADLAVKRGMTRLYKEYEAAA